MCIYLPRLDDEDGAKIGENSRGGGGCTPEAQGVCNSSVYGSHISGKEFEQAQKERTEAGIPPLIPYNIVDEMKKQPMCDAEKELIKSLMVEPKEEQTSADKISALCDELKRFLLVKNERYGDSALKPVKIFSKGDASDKIDIRMDDKMSRIIESDEQRMNDFVDLTGYLVLKCIDKGWTDFSELLD